MSILSLDTLDKYRTFIHTPRVDPAEIIARADRLGLDVPSELRSESRLTVLRAGLEPVIVAARESLEPANVEPSDSSSAVDPAPPTPPDPIVAPQPDPATTPATPPTVATVAQLHTLRADMERRFGGLEDTLSKVLAAVSPAPAAEPAPPPPTATPVAGGAPSAVTQPDLATASNEPESESTSEEPQPAPELRAIERGDASEASEPAPGGTEAIPNLGGLQAPSRARRDAVATEPRPPSDIGHDPVSAGEVVDVDRRGGRPPVRQHAPRPAAPPRSSLPPSMRQTVATAAPSIPAAAVTASAPAPDEVRASQAGLAAQLRHHFAHHVPEAEVAATRAPQAPPQTFAQANTPLGVPDLDPSKPPEDTGVFDHIAAAFDSLGKAQRQLVALADNDPRRGAGLEGLARVKTLLSEVGHPFNTNVRR